VNFIDTADSYGPEVSEKLIAETLYSYPGRLGGLACAGPRAGRRDRAVDDALRQAEDSLRLNPRGLWLQAAPISLRGRLETPEHA
jgi:pyridoxine 4-dehydrogenase